MKTQKKTITELMSFFDNTTVFNDIKKRETKTEKENPVHVAKMKSILERLERKHDGKI